MPVDIQHGAVVIVGRRFNNVGQFLKRQIDAVLSFALETACCIDKFVARDGIEPWQEWPIGIPRMALGVEADQNFLDQIFCIVCAKSGLGEAMLNEPSQQLRDVTEQSLIGSGYRHGARRAWLQPKGALCLLQSCPVLRRKRGRCYAGGGVSRQHHKPVIVLRCSVGNRTGLSERIASMQIKHGVRS